MPMHSSKLAVRSAEALPECGLTHRSTGAPTAGHQARAAGTRYIVCGPGLASCRRRPVSSTLDRRARRHSNGPATSNQGAPNATAIHAATRRPRLATRPRAATAPSISRRILAPSISRRRVPHNRAAKATNADHACALRQAIGSGRQGNAAGPPHSPRLPALPKTEHGHCQAVCRAQNIPRSCRFAAAAVQGGHAPCICKQAAV